MTLRSENRPWYKQRWPWFLIAGPGIVVIAGFITLWMAIDSDDGLVTDDYYKQGLTVNQRMQRDHQASSMGLRADIMRSDLGFVFCCQLTRQLTCPTKSSCVWLIRRAPVWIRQWP